jgi:blocked-early-in-transport protein 1
MRNNRGAEDVVEAQNREYHDRLSDKTSFLKSLAYDIEMEAKDHNRLLDSVDDDFDSTGSFLSGTLNRVTKMVGSGRNNRKLMCYVSLGVIFLIFFIYFISVKMSSSSSHK